MSFRLMAAIKAGQRSTKGTTASRTPSKAPADDVLRPLGDR